MFHGAHDAGKGDVPRRVDQRKYDAGWLRAFGRRCPVCKKHPQEGCTKCGGIGYVEKKRRCWRKR